MERAMNLPEVKKIKNLPLNFPKNWQAVIFRNYGIVPVKNIAQILNTDENTINTEAVNLGLSNVKYNKNWLSKGYISIIRNNWHLLSYIQITQLLCISKQHLAFILKEDDFLDVKLGNFKPYVIEPKYSPLNNEQKKQTKKIKNIVESYYIPYQKQPFDFFDKNINSYNNNFNNESIKGRIIYSYFALYGDSLASGDNESYPDYLLQRYANLNINGIWLQGLLYQLSEYPFDNSLSHGYEKRRENLNALIKRCKKYGIKVYLYFNEPRAMNEAFFIGKEDIKGEQFDELYSLCTSKKVVGDYLYNSIKDLFSACPDLGGMITITMSENLTHCYSKSYDGKCNCPVCKEREAEEVAAEINNIFYNAVKDSGSKAKVIANLWGWDEFMRWDIEKTKKGISLLDKNIDIMLISENCMKINKGGIQNTIIDYSISNVGPSNRSKILFKYVKEQGHNIFAKVQINNSWECSAVPYIPVFDLIKRHINNLKNLNIDGLMLSWTVGGYPGGGLNFISNGYGSDNFNEDNWYRVTFGNEYIKIKKAVNLFSEAFENFPFDLNFLYNGPQNMGCGNLWYAENTNLKSTMVGFPYDDIEGWRGEYSKEILADQLKKLSDKWKEGIDLLDMVKDDNSNIIELKTIANACYAHFNSSYMLCEFILKREEYSNSNDKKIREEINNIIEKEIQNTLILYKAQSQNACIGFEASNHYYYNENTLLEKLVNLNNLKEYYLEK
ncbi:MAG: hypothetical protein PHE12_00075 [Clostridia bacterium]|nr:hypothetical protein [Clostridia bacterium]